MQKKNTDKPNLALTHPTVLTSSQSKEIEELRTFTNRVQQPGGGQTVFIGNVFEIHSNFKQWRSVFVPTAMKVWRFLIISRLLSHLGFLTVFGNLGGGGVLIFQNQSEDTINFLKAQKLIDVLRPPWGGIHRKARRCQHPMTSQMEAEKEKDEEQRKEREETMTGMEGLEFEVKNKPSHLSASAMRGKQKSTARVLNQLLRRFQGKRKRKGKEKNG
jgi:hypothetical protein